MLSSVDVVITVLIYIFKLTEFSLSLIRKIVHFRFKTSDGIISFDFFLVFDSNLFLFFLISKYFFKVPFRLQFF